MRILFIKVMIVLTFMMVVYYLGDFAVSLANYRRMNREINREFVEIL